MNEVENYIYSHEPIKREMFLFVREVLHRCIPKLQEKIAYKIPFFRYYSSFCYLKPTKKGIDLSFLRGQELSNQQGVLEYRTRKQVASLHYCNISEINETTLREIIHEAAILQEYCHHQKNKK